MFTGRYNKILALVLSSLFCVALIFTAFYANAPVAEAQGTAVKPEDKTDPNELNFVGQYIGNAIMGVTSKVTWLGGVILQTSIDALVLDMGNKLASNSGLGEAVDNAWAIVRDFANLIFIFGFVYIGILTILDYENTRTKRFLASIIIGAILINFSLFITKAVVDFSNILALEIHAVMIDTMQIGANPTATQNVGNKFAEILGIISIVTPQGEVLEKNSKGGGFWYYVMGGIFLMVAGFVFAAGGILLIVRFVGLVLIMVFSPILFAATVFPQTARYASMLWQKLFGYALFAPVYFFLLLITYHLASKLSEVAFRNELGNVLGSGTGNRVEQGEVVINFIVVIMFMIFALMAAQRIGVAGGDQAVKIGQSARRMGQRAVVGGVRATGRTATRTAGTVALGGAAALGRNTLGRYGNKLANDGTLKDRAATSWLAKQQFKLAGAAAGASFDARQVGGVGKKLNIGTGTKGGYAGAVKEAEKKEQAFIDKLGTVDDDDEWVVQRKNELKEEERKLRALRKDRNNNPEAYHDQQVKVNEAKERVEKEKNRRAVGSTYDKSERDSKVTQAKDVYEITRDSAKDTIKKLRADRTKAKGYDDIQKIDQEIAKIKKAEKLALEELKKAQSVAGMDVGYIRKINDRGWLQTAVTGRASGVNQRVAENLRIKYDKKVKKTKEDLATDAITGAIEKNASKSDD